MAVHVRFESCYIFMSSSAKQQREMTKFYVFSRTRTALAKHVKPEQAFRPIDVLN